MIRGLLVFCLTSSLAQAQVLSWSEFSAASIARSPEVRVAQTLVREAQAARMSASAAFEPQLNLSSEGKVYQGDLQYRLDLAEARIGLPGGIDIVGGAAQAQGFFINPERSTPAEGILNLGISAPLGGGIVFSDRQYHWGAAQRNIEIAEARLDRVERKTMVDAVKVYTTWQAQTEVQRAVDEARAIAEERLRLVREAFRLGERSGMDTLEAYLSWMDRRADAANQANLTFAAVSVVEQFLRGADTTVNVDLLALSPEVRPVLLQNLSMEPSMVPFMPSIPEVTIANSALRRERLATTTAWAQWLPAPNVDFRLLQWGGSEWNPEAAQWRLGLALPLFNFRARAELASAQARLNAAIATASATQNRMEVLQIQLSQQVMALAEEVKALTASETAAYALLLQERRRFDLGESTMFILAIRETKYLDAKQKRSLTSAKLQSLEAERRLLTSPSL